MEQEIHGTQPIRQTWFQLGDKNNKYFQTMAIIRNRRNIIWKTKDEHSNCYEDQEGISQTITTKF